jgi:outer membrane autotransporter protein
MPAPDFAGVATVQYTLSNGAVTSAPAAIAFTVVPRPDPARDPEVLGLLDAQSQAARRFATAQIGNVRQRLERLHGAGDGRYGFSDGLTFATTGSPCASRVGARPGEACAQPAADDTVVRSRRRRDFLFGTWVAGTLGRGDRDARNGRAALDFETEGLSAGGDMRIGQGYLGAGVGYGRDRTWVGDDDTRSDAHAYSLTVYGGYAPGDVFFLDGVLGYQSLRFDLRRSLTATTGSVGGRRDGGQWFAALTAGADVERGRWQLSPYGRLEVTRATLDGYREQGDPVYALRYDEQDLRSSSANLGLRVDYRRSTRWGLFAPQLRLEYQHDFTGDSSATLRYADWAAGPGYRARLQGFERNRWEIGLGALFENRAEWAFTFGYRGLLDDSGSDHGLMFDIQREF